MITTRAPDGANNNNFLKIFMKQVFSEVRLSSLHVKIRNRKLCRIKRICMLATVLTFENTFDTLTFDILTFENTFDTTADSTLYPRRRLDTGTVLRWLTPWPKSQDIFDHKHNMFFVLQKLFPRNIDFCNPDQSRKIFLTTSMTCSLSKNYFPEIKSFTTPDQGHNPPTR